MPTEFQSKSWSHVSTARIWLKLYLNEVLISSVICTTEVFALNLRIWTEWLQRRQLDECEYFMKNNPKRMMVDERLLFLRLWIWSEGIKSRVCDVRRGWLSFSVIFWFLVPCALSWLLCFHQVVTAQMTLPWKLFYRTKSTKSCVMQGDESKGVMSRWVGGRGVPVSSITDPLCEVDLCGLCWFGSLI